MTNEEKQRIDENFKKLMKDGSGKMILSFLFMSMLMPKEELKNYQSLRRKYETYAEATNGEWR